METLNASVADETAVKAVMTALADASPRSLSICKWIISPNIINAYSI
jgi:hypothetical protein